MEQDTGVLGRRYWELSAGLCCSLIKHTRLGEGSDIYVFLTPSDAVGKNRQVCGHECFGDVFLFYQTAEGGSVTHSQFALSI